jgi:peptidoglycan hydrolase-like protein with peptidoglycan-binding domain
LKLGTSGTDVKKLQIFLNAHGFPVATYGAGSSGHETTYFGPATQIALAKFQQKNGITPAQGYLGPKTLAFISSFQGTTAPITAGFVPTSISPMSASTFARNLTRGDVGVDVQNLQKYLNANGFQIANFGPGSPGHETTHFESATQYQLSRFQRANGITPNVGYFGPKTRSLIDR